ncbi:MAG: D-2-hydroxyacid dehydrogenase [Saprospiraceae bacterium]
MKIVFLDAYTTVSDGLSLELFNSLGDFKSYDDTLPTEVVARAIDAEIVITNKVVLDRSTIEKLQNLKLICVAATGYNNIDIQAATDNNIPVSNVKGYSTNGVAQHVFAQILNAVHQIAYYDDEVRNERWNDEAKFCFYDHSIVDLKGKTLGIYGYGTIGKQVAEIGRAFGMTIIANTRTPKFDANVEFVSFEALCEKSDFITLHASLSKENEGIINYKTLKLMKKSVVIINTGRGGLIIEQDLANALIAENIKYACLDVLNQEPPNSNNPLLSISNCSITPHQAWASIESRTKLLQGVAGNIKRYIEGNGSYLNM